MTKNTETPKKALNSLSMSDLYTLKEGDKIETIRYTDNRDIIKTFTVERAQSYKYGSPQIKFKELKSTLLIHCHTYGRKKGEPMDSPLKHEISFWGTGNFILCTYDNSL